MLFPLVVALWDKHRLAEAAEVGRAVLAMEPDRSIDYHHLWTGLALLIEGDVGTAESLLTGLVPAGFNEYYRDVHRLAVESARIVAAEQRPGAGMSFAAAQRQMKAVFKGLAESTTRDKLIQWMYHRLMWRIAKQYNRPLSAALSALAGFFK